MEISPAIFDMIRSCRQFNADEIEQQHVVNSRLKMFVFVSIICLRERVGWGVLGVLHVGVMPI